MVGANCCRVLYSPPSLTHPRRLRLGHKALVAPSSIPFAYQWAGNCVCGGLLTLHALVIKFASEGQT